MESLRNRDPLPHEVIHLVVERASGWCRGLWGSVAGGYRVKGTKEAGKRQARLLSEAHKADLGAAEQQVIALTAAWIAGSPPADEVQRRIWRELDELRTEWAVTGVLTLDWPDTLVPRR